MGKQVAVLAEERSTRKMLVGATSLDNHLRDGLSELTLHQ
jgi:hypothetical protein